MTSTIDGATEPAQVLPDGAALAEELLAADGSAVDGSAGDGSAADGGQPGGPAGDAGQPPRFLEGKLQIPQPHFPVLRRRRITGLLDQAARNRVTLISGPAGAGKTVACATWASATAQSRRVAWLTVDAEDQQSWFWAYVCAALARLRAIPADVLRSLEDTSPDRFPLRLVEAAQLFTEPVVLILDDVHELADPAVLTGLDLIIRHAPGTLRLVLSARQPPALQLARLRVSGELADIGGADLACTADEADAYFAMLGLDVDQGARDELLRRTQGWMAGLRLAAMRARSDPEPGAKITDLVGDEPIVTDYLWDEVLGKQPPQTRMFLLRTSITGAVSGDLADALTGQGGSARTLERLSRENSFVEVVDRERGGYAYHPLLREVLAAELHREIPHEIPVLLRRAARWYAAHDQPFRSVRCAAQAGGLGLRGADPGRGGRRRGHPGVAPRSWRACWRCSRRTARRMTPRSPRPGRRPGYGTAITRARPRTWKTASTPWAGPRRRMRRVMEPVLAALRVMLAGCRCDPDPGLLGPAQSLAERCAAAASAQPEHRAAGLLWFAVGVARLRRWEIQAARHALRHADRQLAAGQPGRAAGPGAGLAGAGRGLVRRPHRGPAVGQRRARHPRPETGHRRGGRGTGRAGRGAGQPAPRRPVHRAAADRGDQPGRGRAVPRRAAGQRGDRADPGPGAAGRRRRDRRGGRAVPAPRDLRPGPPGPVRRGHGGRGRRRAARRQHRPGPRGAAAGRGG